MPSTSPASMMRYAISQPMVMAPSDRKHGPKPPRLMMGNTLSSSSAPPRKKTGTLYNAKQRKEPKVKKKVKTMRENVTIDMALETLRSRLVPFSDTIVLLRNFHFSERDVQNVLTMQHSMAISQRAWYHAERLKSLIEFFFGREWTKRLVDVTPESQNQKTGANLESNGKLPAVVSKVTSSPVKYSIQKRQHVVQRDRYTVSSTRNKSETNNSGQPTIRDDPDFISRCALT